MSIKPSEIQDAVRDLRVEFATGKTLSESWRRSQLEALLKMLQEGRGELCEAMKRDLNKSHFEGYMTELNMVEMECSHALAHLSDWMKPEWKTSNLFNIPTLYSQVKHDPLGVVLVMGAWNYNIVLTLTPLIGAIAGGNCVMLKPGSYAVYSGQAMAKLVTRYMDTKCIKIVEGDREVNGALLREKWDLIFCTGSSLMGRLVAKAAAEHLTPIVLELGGKSPCVVEESCDLGTAARRILHGALLNAGQTCVRPDHFFVQESIAKSFIETLKSTLVDFYGTNPKESEWYGRIINDKSFKRVSALVESSRQYIVHGGEVDAKTKFVAPTVFDFGADWNAFEKSAMMQEEVFGPLIPVVYYKDLKDVVKFINSREKPLAMYAFTGSSSVIQQLQDQTTSGGFMVNDACAHISNNDLPFGGVGMSDFYFSPSLSQ
jgi:acyl-CoA reductase-like NAD-dependent aldehyde dehydrogenase